MRRTLLSLSTMALTLMVASGLALAVGVGSAAGKNSVVGPGESIQKAIYAADPGDTIVVKGVHREDVVIRKNGIKLRGDDAVIEPPARADSPCSKAFGPEAICVLGDVNIKTGELTGQRVSDVSVSGFTIRGFRIKSGRYGDAFVIDVFGARDATIVGNRAIDNIPGGIAIGRSINTTYANNDVIGNPENNTNGIDVEADARNTKIVNNVVRSYTQGIAVDFAVDTTIEGNDVIDNALAGIGFADTTGTKILSNNMRHNGIVGLYLAGQKSENAKLVGNNISGGPWGIYVEGAHGGSFVGNKVHDNCAGMFFEAFKSQPLGGFKVTGNTVEDNTRSCRAAQFDRNFSGIGIALLGASGMEVTANHLSGNVPSGPTPISGGVVVSTDPYFRGTTFGGKQKPKNNSIIGNHFGRNKPDIFWDKSGSGNRFVGNFCDTSVPTRLCN